MRFQRVGKKHQPGYRLVVAEKRSKLGAPPVEDLGSYDPVTKKATFNKERISHWIQKGADPSVTVHNLLVKEGILNAPKIKMEWKVPPKEAEPAGEAPAAPEAAPAEAAKAEEPAPASAEPAA